MNRTRPTDVEESDVFDRLADRLMGQLDPRALRADSVPARIGRYAVVRPLGRGAFGRVYLADDPRLGRQVAVKVLARMSSGAESRFQREMQVLARLEHPGIVRVYDAGICDEGPFFVMEFVDQPALDDAQLSLEEAVRTLEGVARACHVAHSEGIVHRDLKPSNILVGERAVILDFGIARVLNEDGEDTRAPIGTPDYMAPEQATSAAVGAWTDVHALGAILYEVLSGRTPFEADSIAEILERVRDEIPAPLSEVAPAAPRALASLAESALAKDPAQRPDSALAFAEALRSWLEPSPARSAAVPLVAAALVVLVVSGALWALASRSGGNPAPATPSSPADQDAQDPGEPARHDAKQPAPEDPTLPAADDEPPGSEDDGLPPPPPPGWDEPPPGNHDPARPPADDRPPPPPGRDPGPPPPPPSPGRDPGPPPPPFGGPPPGDRPPPPGHRPPPRGGRR